VLHVCCSVQVVTLISIKGKGKGTCVVCVLQCVAVYCSVLQCVAVCCSVRVAILIDVKSEGTRVVYVLQCIAVYCRLLQCVLQYVLQCVACVLQCAGRAIDFCQEQRRLNP